MAWMHSERCQPHIKCTFGADRDLLLFFTGKENSMSMRFPLGNIGRGRSGVSKSTFRPMEENRSLSGQKVRFMCGGGGGSLRKIF